MRSFKQKNNKYVLKRYSWYLLVGQAFVRGELLEENDGNMSKLLYYAFNLTILNLMTEHKYTKVYTKACILNNSVYAVLKARTHIYGVYGWKVTSLHFVNMILAQKWSPEDPLRCVTFHKYTAKKRSTLAHFITWSIKIKHNYIQPRGI